MHLRNFSTESQISFFSFLLANRISVGLWKTLNNWLVWHNFPTFESFNGLSKDHHPSMINIPNETGGQTGTENMPFLVFAWKPNENLKFYCIVLLSSSHSSIAILISSRTFPKALLIFKRASQKKTDTKIVIWFHQPPSPTFGNLDQLLSAKWIEKNLCCDPLPNNHEFHHRPQKTFSNHSTLVNQIIIKSGYEDHLSFRADGFGRIFKAPGEHLDKMEWNKSKCIHTQIKYKIKYVHGWIEVWISKQQPNTNKPLKSWEALKEEEEPLFLLEIADKTLMLGHTPWWQDPEDPEQLSLCLLQESSVKWDKGGWQTSR